MAKYSASVPPLLDRQPAGGEALKRLIAKPVGYLVPEDELVEHRWHLAPQERRCDEFLATEGGFRLLADSVQRQLDRQASVANEQRLVRVA